MKNLLLIAHILNYIILIVLFLLEDLKMQGYEKLFIFMGISAIILVATLISYAVDRKRKNINEMTLKDMTLFSIILSVFNIMGIPALIILMGLYFPN